MEKPNAQLEAMLSDFARRSSSDPGRAAQLRAAVEANELTVRTFNAGAASGAIRSFDIDADAREVNHVGRFDPERGSVTLPPGAFGNVGSAPTQDLVATCRVQSMLVAFSSGAATNGGNAAGGASSEMVSNLQNTLNESPALASEIKRAATTQDSASPQHYGLERLELLSPNANIGGAYVGETHTMLLPAEDLTRGHGGRFRPAALTFVVGHEIQHSFNRADALHATSAFNESVDTLSRSASPVHDYTPVLAGYLGEVRKDEARGQIAGWNAVQSRIEAAGGPVTLETMGNADDRMRDFVPFPKSIDDPVAIRSDIVLNADMTMSSTPGNIEAMGRHYFDRPARDHVPPGNDERVMGLNYDHVSNYPNHYGKQAIEQILAAEEKAPLFHGNKPEITIDMAKLGLYEDVLERQGLDLTKSHGNGQYFDSTQLPSAPHHFNHTASGKDAHNYVPIAPDVSAVQLPEARGRNPLLAEVRDRLPPDTSDDRIAQIALAAKEGGIEPGMIRTLDVQADRLLLTGMTPGTHAVVDLSVPPPASPVSEAKLDAIQSQQDAQVMQQQQVQSQQATQGVSLTR